jgi:hypothetical protein
MLGGCTPVWWPSTPRETTPTASSMRMELRPMHPFLPSHGIFHTSQAQQNQNVTFHPAFHVHGTSLAAPADRVTRTARSDPARTSVEGAVPRAIIPIHLDQFAEHSGQIAQYEVCDSEGRVAHGKLSPTFCRMFANLSPFRPSVVISFFL